ncbi:hypothetical protein, partial [Klebsiella pneumoniae]|uniref:hypothetical protein n=1 Tax=Klebsiella pneumoniae TaxID=573 RepID=UPI0038542562
DTEKKSVAESMSEPFSRRATAAQEMVDYIKDLEVSTQLASVNLANLMREREAMAKINRQYVDRGNNNIFARSLHKSVDPLSLTAE